MKKFYLLAIAVVLFIAPSLADEYLVCSWTKSKLATDTIVSADKVLVGKKLLAETDKLRINAYDSLVLVSKQTSRTCSFVNRSDKPKVVVVRDITRRRSLSVLISMLSETFSPKKTEQQYKILATTSREQITQENVDEQHMAIYNTLLYYVEKDNYRAFPKNKHLSLYADTIDDVIHFTIENTSRTKSYMVNIVVYDPATHTLDLAVTFPEHTSAPTLAIGPYSRLTIEDLGYAVRKDNPLRFYLMVSRVPFDANYLQRLLQARNIKPTRDSKTKDIVCIKMAKSK